MNNSSILGVAEIAVRMNTVEGATLQNIADHLNAERIPSRQGAAWNQLMLKRVIDRASKSQSRPPAPKRKNPALRLGSFFFRLGRGRSVQTARRHYPASWFPGGIGFGRSRRPGSRRLNACRRYQTLEFVLN
jgi:hypothetical protein